ncbi:glycosyltransferase family 2 protein [Blastochloris sulfoviridis]|uniref:Glycosyltransferase n=1 Tax=Blastochloris sulfoviridis TaxID=50712 RepID=A0A5M6HNA5_9HYPH|nr:glycosyltransferase [Blastochloris sulfoviridis]KAA5597158.1 glycosyltransferase [Blastochloris sulfoviridis]
MASISGLFADPPLVTLYVPCRNYGRFLEQAIRSIHAQLYPHWELFIIDEASEDETPIVAERLRSECPDRIHVITHAAPRGLQKTANSVLEKARGRYIMRLDADDWLDESALLLMVAKLESEPAIGLVYGNYFYTDPDGRVLGMERRYKLGQEDVVGHLPPHGACTMVRTRALKAVGGYSEDVDAQDGWELWYKLMNRVKAVSLDAPLFYYRQHGASLSRDSNRLLTARARIFGKLRQQMEGSYKPSCLAVIAVKESYPGFEDVPYQEVGGQSLLQHALGAAQGAAGVTDVMISTTSPNVLDYARRLEDTGTIGPYMQTLRSESAPAAPLPIQAILQHAGEAYRAERGSYPDAVAFLSIHAPLRRREHVEKGIDILRITCSDSVVSVTEEREPIFAHGPQGLKLLNPGRMQNLTYDRERLYRFNGAFLALWWEVLGDADIFGETIAYMEMSAEDSVQVKRPSDLALLRRLLEEAAPTHA